MPAGVDLISVLERTGGLDGGDDSGSGPATADKRSNGSSDGSEAEGEMGEALRGAWAACEEANRSCMSSSNSERKEEGAAAVSADDEVCQLDSDIVDAGWARVGGGRRPSGVERVLSVLC